MHLDTKFKTTEEIYAWLDNGGIVSHKDWTYGGDGIRKDGSQLVYLDGDDASLSMDSFMFAPGNWVKKVKYSGGF